MSCHWAWLQKAYSVSNKYGGVDLTGGGAWDGGGWPLRAAKRSSISSAEGTGRLGAFRAARRDSISFSDGTDSEEKVKRQKITSAKRKHFILTVHIKVGAATDHIFLLGTVSSLSFWSLSAIAWSSLLRPLVGMWPALLSRLPPCARGCEDWPCCLASNAATRLRKKYDP